jgi:hypothetical protein
MQIFKAAIAVPVLIASVWCRGRTTLNAVVLERILYEHESRLWMEWPHQLIFAERPSGRCAVSQ